MLKQASMDTGRLLDIRLMKNCLYFNNKHFEGNCYPGGRNSSNALMFGLKYFTKSVVNLTTNVELFPDYSIYIILICLIDNQSIKY